MTSMPPLSHSSSEATFATLNGQLAYLCVCVYFMAFRSQSVRPQCFAHSLNGEMGATLSLETTFRVGAGKAGQSMPTTVDRFSFEHSLMYGRLRMAPHDVVYSWQSGCGVRVTVNWNSQDEPPTNGQISLRL